MDKQLVGELDNVKSPENNNQYIMVITDTKRNQLNKESVTNFFKRVPDTGVTVDTYPYPINLQVNSKGQIISVEKGEPGANNADQDLSNISENGKDVIRKYSNVFSLFDNKVTDHILEGNDAIGWALQGSLITNVYADAVNKIKEEYNNGIPSQNPILELPEANKTINIKENTLALIPNGFNEDGTKKYTTYKYSSDFPKDTGTTTSDIHTYLWSTENGGCWDITEYHISDTAPVVSDNNAVWYDTKNNKIKRTDTQGASWEEELLSLPMAKVTTSGILVDESHYGFKSIDEIYNGFEFLEILKFPYTKAKNGHRIADITQKDAVDNLFSTTGIADFYILDSTNNQFYLPRSRWFAQFTLDTNLVNSFNEAGLPNILGKIDGSTGPVSAEILGELDPTWVVVEGAFEQILGTQHPLAEAASPGTFIRGIKFDASKSNPTYGTSETVQPASSNKLLYYKVGNTLVNESTIDIGNVLSELQLKADKDFSNVTNPYVKETYTKGTEGYRLYSDGWCIQWGYIACVAYPPLERTIFFLKEYKDTNYIYTEGVISDSQNIDWWFAHQAGAVKQKDTSGFTKLVIDTPLNPGTVSGYYWKTEGYIKG